MALNSGGGGWSLVSPLSLDPSQDAGPQEVLGSPVCLSHLVTEQSTQGYSKSEQLTGTRARPPQLPPGDPPKVTHQGRLAFLPTDLQQPQLWIEAVANESGTPPRAITASARPQFLPPAAATQEGWKQAQKTSLPFQGQITPKGQMHEASQEIQFTFLFSVSLPAC